MLRKKLLRLVTRRSAAPVVTPIHFSGHNKLPISNCRSHRPLTRVCHALGTDRSLRRHCRMTLCAKTGRFATRPPRLLDREERPHSASHTARKILDPTRRGDCDLRHVVDCIQADPALAARIPRVVNSAHDERAGKAGRRITSCPEDHSVCSMIGPRQAPCWKWSNGASLATAGACNLPTNIVW